MLRGRLVRLGAAGVASVAAVVALGSRLPGGEAVESSLQWRRVLLPGQVAPSAIATDGDAVVVGTRLASGEPGLLVSTDGRSWDARPATPTTVKGPVSRWTRVAVAGGRVVGVGASSGGAHGILRWTVWRGDTESGVREQAQPFETFGGPDAGTLADVDLVAGREPVVLGSWSGSTGFDVSLWLDHDGRYERGGWTGPALRSDSQRLASGVDLEPWRRGGLVVGQTTTLSGSGVRTRPAVWWSGSLGASWVPVELQAERTATDGRGHGASCAGSGACWVVGRLDGDVVAWRLLRPDATAPLVARVPLAGDGTISPPLVLPHRVVAVAETDRRVVLVDLTGERVRPGPPGSRVLGAAATATTVYVVTEGADGETGVYAADVPAVERP